MNLHLHHGIEADLCGAGRTSTDAGKDPIALPTGADLMNLRMIQHGGFKGCWSAEPENLYSTCGGSKNKPLYDASSPIKIDGI